MGFTAARREAIGAVALATAGVGVRLWFGARFPTEPISDFRGLVMFGLQLRDGGITAPSPYWTQFSVGLPLLLAGLFHAFPNHVTAVARIATAGATGLVPLLPFALWRGAFPFRTRVLAGVFLSLWPGLVFYSNVPAQENWVLMPTVALAALAARPLCDAEDCAHPLAAGLLYALAASIRQEMLLVLAPAAIAAAGLPGRPWRRGSRALCLTAAAAIPLLALAFERRAATGRFAITTEHGGVTVLGTFAPGSAAAGWTDPTLYIASVEPALLRDNATRLRSAWTLARKEALRRYRFHVFRSAVAALRLSVESDAQSLFWTLEAPGVQADSRAADAAAWARAVRPVLRLELALASGFFFAALGRGVRRRDKAVLLIGGTALLRILVQVAFSPLGRLMVPTTALELMTIALSIGGGVARHRRSAVGFAALGLAGAALLLAVEPPLDRLAIRKDEPPPTVLHFPLGIANGRGAISSCSIESGRLTALSGNRASVGPLTASTSGTFRVVCRLPEALPDGVLGLDLERPEGRLVEAEVDGHAVTETSPLPESDWLRLYLPAASGPGTLVLRGSSDGRPCGFRLVLVRPTELPPSRPPGAAVRPR